MPRTGYQNCIELMKYIFKRDFKYEVPEKIIDQAIKRKIGTDRRTLTKYKNDLVDLGFIEPINDSAYKISKSPRPYEGFYKELEVISDKFEEIIGYELNEVRLEA